MLEGSENIISILPDLELECKGGVIAVRSNLSAAISEARECLLVYCYAEQRVTAQFNSRQLAAIGWNEVCLLRVIASIQQVDAYRELRELSKQSLLDSDEKALFTHATAVQLDFSNEISIELRCAYVSAIAQAILLRRKLNALPSGACRL